MYSGGERFKGVVERGKGEGGGEVKCTVVERDSRGWLKEGGGGGGGVKCTVEERDSRGWLKEGGGGGGGGQVYSGGERFKGVVERGRGEGRRNNELTKMIVVSCLL